MITYWLIALLIGLLLFDFTSYLRTVYPSSHAPWTIPSSLVIVSTVVATFCIGLAWRYVITASALGIGNQNADVLGVWLPYVLTILALCIIAGVVEAWRGTSPSNKPIKEPYRLLETAHPIFPQNSIASLKQNWLIMRSVTLAFSVLIGFVGAAFLLQFSLNGSEGSFFAVERIRPTPQAISVAPVELFDEVPVDEVPVDEVPVDEVPVDEVPVDELEMALNASNDAEQQEVDSPTNRQPEAVEATIDRLENTDGEAMLAIGGPVKETPLEAISNSTEQAPETEVTNAVLTIEDNASENNVATGVTNDAGKARVENKLKLYSVVVQATLGVKVRTQPSTEGDIVDVLDYGTSIQAIGRTIDGNWVLVKPEGKMAAWITTEAVDGLLFDESGQIITLDELPSIAP